LQRLAQHYSHIGISQISTAPNESKLESIRHFAFNKLNSAP
jgi:hypothetical protein